MDGWVLGECTVLGSVGVLVCKRRGEDDLSLPLSASFDTEEDTEAATLSITFSPPALALPKAYACKGDTAAVGGAILPCAAVLTVPVDTAELAS